MNNTHQLIEQLVNYAAGCRLSNLPITTGNVQFLLRSRNIVYVRNLIYSKLNLTPQDNIDLESYSYKSITQIIDEIFLNLSPEQLNNLGDNNDVRQSNLINCLLPLPDSLELDFATILSKYSSKDALDWYYKFSCAIDYIKLEANAKNVSWVYPSEYGDICLTINLAKPEKDPAVIALEAKQVNSNKYPKCQLCVENEGFAGNLTQSSRYIHRMQALTLNDQSWFFQFSPYSYFEQHAIILNANHCAMRINLITFENLFAFVDFAPHYIVGANSDIPIVGGSILSHDHYQAGYTVFPIETAKVLYTKQSLQFPSITLNYLNWPLSTLQLIGNKHDLLRIIPQIIDAWYGYSNPELGIIATTNNTRHNAITPIVRKIDADKYTVYLILRNNRCDEIHPNGIFHPHSEHHHIKKENIGLIEAMGLAILPSRLKSELLELENLLGGDINPLGKYQDWFTQINQQYISTMNKQQFMQDKVGEKFVSILQDCGVFKGNQQGMSAAFQFIESLL